MKLTVQQRLNLEGMIRQQRSPDDETLMLNFDLLQKVRIPESERPLYLRDSPGGGIEFLGRAIQVAPVIEVELNSAEVRRLEALLREWKQYGTDDVEWLMAIKKQITAINSGVATTTKPDGAPGHPKRERAAN